MSPLNIVLTVHVKTNISGVLCKRLRYSKDHTKVSRDSREAGARGLFPVDVKLNTEV